MKLRTLSQQNKYNPFLFQQPIFNDQDQSSIIVALVAALSPRNRIIESIYKAQKILSFSKSTLYLAIGILDKLICLDLSLTNENSDLICGTLLLMCTKFNEAHPVTIKKLNRLMKNQYLQDYVDMEGYFLHKLDFNLYLEDTLYQDLSILESKLPIDQAKDGQYIIKSTLLNPQKTFKSGSKSLINAIENLLSGNIPKNLNNYQHKLMLQIRGQLFKLHLGTLN